LMDLQILNGGVCSRRIPAQNFILRKNFPHLFLFGAKIGRIDHIMAIYLRDRYPINFKLIHEMKLNK
jgi:hypothetical protein